MPKPRILLVDDEERFRVNLQKMLGAQGLAVGAAGSGEAAMEELKVNPFDVIVLDIRMPGMDGLATLKEIKTINPEVEVIILSGHASIDHGHGDRTGWGLRGRMKPCPWRSCCSRSRRPTTRSWNGRKGPRKPHPQTFSDRH